MFRNLLLLFLLLHTTVKFNFKPLFKYSAICVFDSSTSSISKEELKKFTEFFGEVKWVKTLDDKIKKFEFLILCKGNLTLKEKNIIFEFLKNGGGFILFLPRIYDEKFYNQLGIYTYSPLKNKITKIKFHPLISDNNCYKFNFYKGIIVKTGYGGKIAQPTKGNVFPERIPVRAFQILVSGWDEEDGPVASAIVLVKHFYNPWNIHSRTPRNWLVFSGQNFNFSNSFYKKLYTLIIRNVYIKNLKPSLPVYYQQEKPKITAVIKNRAKATIEIKAWLEIYNQNGEKIYSAWRKKRITKTDSLLFTPLIKFPPGIYTVKLLLYDYRGELIDIARDLFLYTPDELIKDRGKMVLSVNGNRIVINGKPQFIWGTNYYESRKGELNWLEPDLYRINEDFQLMRKLGLKMVRIHYHHPKWFRDYLRKNSSEFLKFFPEKSYLPDEKDLRILDAIIYLARLNGLIICLDLFTLVPEEMGNPLGWLSMTVRIEDEEKIKHQLEFVKLIATRYRNISGITWDLWNEPRLEEDKIPILRNWAQKIIDEFRKYGDKHLITVGGNDSIYLQDIVDYVSIHSDCIDVRFQSSPETITISVILQEFWLPYSLPDEVQQAGALREVLKDIKKTHYQGFLPWQWTRQSRLWDLSQPEEWDDNLGLFVREDGSLKPAFFIFKEFRPNL